MGSILTFAYPLSAAVRLYYHQYRSMTTVSSLNLQLRQNVIYVGIHLYYLHVARADSFNPKVKTSPDDLRPGARLRRVALQIREFNISRSLDAISLSVFPPRQTVPFRRGSRAVCQSMGASAKLLGGKPPLLPGPHLMPQCRVFHSRYHVGECCACSAGGPECSPVAVL